MREAGLARAALALALAAPAAWAGESVQLFDGAVRAELPDGFTRLSTDELAKKFARSARAPVAAFGDASRTSLIAFTLSDQKGSFQQEQLPQYVAAMEQILPKAVPGIVWHAKEVKPLSGRPWAHLRYASPTVDKGVANDTWFTAFRGNILGVNLSSPASQWTAMEPVLVKAVGSVRIDDAPPSPAASTVSR
ncbi:hypothetical protein [Piscinibacter terrae]|uniref:DUF1795 domain-containing protein n=1 Tax=Piscinibacter terrae TaxID=2496871 RepID=A0A3N7K1M0_9BURK|nr:hypothetical protein [Albitalea terrae]RQP24855.1 hypothetical protein DZC73_08235 [Albitalea terrae]